MKNAWFKLISIFLAGKKVKKLNNMNQRIKSRKLKPRSLNKSMKNERQLKRELHKNPNLQAKRKKLAS